MHRNVAPTQPIEAMAEAAREAYWKNAEQEHTTDKEHWLAAIRAALAVQPSPVDALQERQRVVADWVVRCWGTDALAPHERAARVLEEAIELAQAEGVDRAHTDRTVAMVYSRPPGDPKQEAGGTAMCLLAWAQGRGVSLLELVDAEMSRVLSKPIEHFRKRQAEKCALGVSARFEAQPSPDTRPHMHGCVLPEDHTGTCERPSNTGPSIADLKPGQFIYRTDDHFHLLDTSGERGPDPYLSIKGLLNGQIVKSWPAGGK